MNIVVDRGNTRTKFALFNVDNQITDLFFFDNDSFVLENELLKYDYQKVIFSSVSEYNSVPLPYVLYMSEMTLLPINNIYQSKTIGVDRLALSVGVNFLFPDTNCLVFDFGSAITIDFISSDNTFMGGNIAPGLSMRFVSLYEKTSNLPLLSAKDYQYNLFSDNTEDAIISGVVQSIIYEIEGYIKRYEKKYEKLKIFFTGGDAIFFAKQIKKGIFADENLVLIGLNRILNYNV